MKPYDIHYDDDVIAWRRRRRLLALIMLMGVVGYAGWRWVDRSGDQSRIEALEVQLDYADPRVRLEAAQRILEMDPRHQHAQLVQAEAYVLRGQHLRARALLGALERDDESPHYRRTLELQIENRITEARQVIRSATPRVRDILSANVARLVSEAEERLNTLRTLPGAESQVSLIEAQLLSVRVSELRRQRVFAQGELARARAADYVTETEQAAAKVEQFSRDINQMDARIIALCEAAREDQVASGLADQLLFHLELQQEDIAGARDRARHISEREALDRGVAGDVAMTLLQVDHLFNQPVLGSDLDTAERLLTHPGLVGGVSLDFTTARGILALHQGDAEQAAEIAARVLADSPDHPRSLILHAQALIALGDAQRANDLLDPLNLRMSSLLGRYVQARALTQLGERRRAQEMLRQNAEDAPDYLLNRLALVRTMVEQGFVIEAARDIARAVQTNPEHPEVIELEARLMVERSDHAQLVALLEDHVLAGDPALRDVDLAASMALDDRTRVHRLVSQRIQHAITDRLAFVARAWVTTSSDRRVEVASMITSMFADRLYGSGLDRVPEGWTMSPEALRDRLWPAPVDRAIRPSANDVAVPSEAGLSADPLPVNVTYDWSGLDTAYFARTLFDEALDMVRFARERWPDDRRLMMRELELCLWVADRQDAERLATRLSDDASADQPPGQSLDFAESQAIVHAAKAFLDASAPEQMTSYLDAMAEEEHAATEGAAADSASDSGEAAGRSRRGDPFAVLSEPLPRLGFDHRPTVQWLRLASALEAEAPSSSVIADRLAGLIRGHPMAEPALLMAIRAALVRDDPDQARAYLNMAAEQNPRLATVARARLAMAMHQPEDALRHLAVLGRLPDVVPLQQAAAADIQARANLMLGSVELAAGALETLALTAPHLRLAMSLAAIDAVAASGRASAAAAMLSTALLDSAIPARWLDPLLMRAEILVDARRLQRVYSAMERHAQPPALLPIYRARNQVRLGDPAEAWRQLDRLQAVADHPRVRAANAWMRQRLPDQPAPAVTDATPSPGSDQP